MEDNNNNNNPQNERVLDIDPSVSTELSQNINKLEQLVAEIDEEQQRVNIQLPTYTYLDLIGIMYDCIRLTESLEMIELSKGTFVSSFSVQFHLSLSLSQNNYNYFLLFIVIIIILFHYFLNYR